MDYSPLARSPLFKGLDNEAIEVILQSLPHRIKKFSPGFLITQSGDPVNSLAIVLSGSVKGEMVDFSGKTIKIEEITAPGAIAAAFMFGSKNIFPVNVISISDTELLTIDKADFLKLLTTNDKVLLNFLDMISNRSQFLSEKIKFLNFKTIKGKLAQYILKILPGAKNEVKLDRTQNDLADYFGVARPSIARVLKEMESEGLIEVKGKTVRIIDRKGLANLTSE